MSKIRLHQNDLPNLSRYNVTSIAVDTETLGLNLHRDRLCLIQISTGDGTVDLVQISPKQKNAPNIVKLLQDTQITKIFHFARFDLAILAYTFLAIARPVFCTKIASKLTRTYSNKHSLQDLCQEFLNITICKKQQSSNWGREKLSNAQQKYAASDVIYLHQLSNLLKKELIREKRLKLAENCFKFLPTRIQLDIMGWSDQDIFAHN
ncbi:MAG: ribonuclease D [Candidatus Tokpelaia sp. JSC161]|jgi:ribonuclease D|nr:MAG: ribonuclease D [Candidatus Tokpelaia sp. JSC161]